MKPSMLPFLVLIQFFAIWHVSDKAENNNTITADGHRFITGLIVLLAIWAGISSLLAINLSYQSRWFLSSWPAFWVTSIAVTIVMTPLMISRAARNTVRGIIDNTPLYGLVLFQGLRTLAIGGIMKSLNGEFALYYGLYIGIPDFIFGLSALVMARLVYQGRATDKAVALWNIAGAMIIVPFGMVLLQMGLPGPMQLFSNEPTITTIFEFPMALAPTVIVPVFVMMNLFVAMRILERTGTTTATRPAQ